MVLSDHNFENIDYKDLIGWLKNNLRSSIKSPNRGHFQYTGPGNSQESTLLTMPAWGLKNYLGVKTVTVTPDNSERNLASINGCYNLFDASNGQLLAVMNAAELTSIRTACVSALMGSILADNSAKSMLMIGTGALAPKLIRAHHSIHKFERIYIWGRNLPKAEALKKELQDIETELIVSNSIDEILPNADIISAATLSKTPLIKGSLLRAGQHIDLVGSYKVDMRESDNEVIRRSKIFVDTYYGGIEENGDIRIPLQEGVITKADICSNMFELLEGKRNFNRLNEDITLFKSVGYASEDLVAAVYFFQKTH